MRDLVKSRAPLFIYLIFVFSVTATVRFKVMVLGLGLVVGLGLGLIFHMSRKSCTASYLAMRHIWHDTGETG